MAEALVMVRPDESTIVRYEVIYDVERRISASDGSVDAGVLEEVDDESEEGRVVNERVEELLGSVELDVMVVVDSSVDVDGSGMLDDVGADVGVVVGAEGAEVGRAEHRVLAGPVRVSSEVTSDVRVLVIVSTEPCA